jgi:hypothetical protein
MTYLSAVGSCVKYLLPLASKNRAGTDELEEMLMQCTREELKQIYDQLTIEVLAEATPEERQEMLKTMDTCPCCDRWMGHNNPPADDDNHDQPYRRQSSFKF